MVLEALKLKGQHILCATGSETVNLKQILSNLRQWLGLKPAYRLCIPLKLIRWIAKIADYIPGIPLNSTSYHMLMKGSTATPEDIRQTQKHLSFKPRGFSTGLHTQLSHVQDRWHAKLYFIRPLLRCYITGSKLFIF